MTTAQIDERDLSFEAITQAPRNLDAEAIAFYNEQGYLTPFTVFTDDESVNHRNYFDTLLKTVMEANDGRDSYAINGYQTRCKGIYDIVTDPRILDIVEDIVGPDIICWASHFFCKLPGDPKHVAWHQDASYWPITPARTVTVWLAIDAADVENSAMMFLPKTHTVGPIPWKDTEKAAVLNQELIGIEAYGDPVHNILKAGQFSLHADMLAHGSLPNKSDRRRCGLTIRYCSPRVRPVTAGWGNNAVLCRGEDTYGNWSYPAIPETDDLSKVSTPGSAIAAN